MLLFLVSFFPALSTVATNTLFCSSLESHGECSVWLTALGRRAWGAGFQRAQLHGQLRNTLGTLALLSVPVSLCSVSQCDVLEVLGA